jgi:hypothetical protein
MLGIRHQGCHIHEDIYTADEISDGAQSRGIAEIGLHEPESAV